MKDVLSVLSTIEILHFYMPKILMATVCGGLIGIEREIKHKAAGIKTNIMICVGATLFAATSFLLYNLFPTTDPTRIISYVVSGIGFLGGGVIFRGGEKVKGLTSAALIWVLSAIGIIIAAGGYVISVIITLGLLGMIVGVGKFESRYFNPDDMGHD
jgi:putative Mg2+ transporter-C (MgtC) family protein